MGRKETNDKGHPKEGEKSDDLQINRLTRLLDPRDKHLNKQEVNYAESSRFARGMAEGAP